MRVRDASRRVTEIGEQGVTRIHHPSIRVSDGTERALEVRGHDKFRRSWSVTDVRMLSEVAARTVCESSGMLEDDSDDATACSNDGSRGESR